MCQMQNTASAASATKVYDMIVIGGGPCTYNPEPIAPFFDLFYIGEGEVVYDQLFDTYLENKKNGGTRLDFLKKACQIPGIYVPQFYEVTYHEDGTVAAFTPPIPEAPEKEVFKSEFAKKMQSGCAKGQDI